MKVSLEKLNISRLSQVSVNCLKLMSFVISGIQLVGNLKWVSKSKIKKKIKKIC